MFIGRRQFIGGSIGAAAGLTYAALPMRPARGGLATPERLRFKAYRGKDRPTIRFVATWGEYHHVDSS